jgi:hypothetical protein
MAPIEDYQLYIFAQGRVLSLLRKPTVNAYNRKINIKGWGVLIRVYDDDGISDIGVNVHMPAGSNQFEIIRP